MFIDVDVDVIGCDSLLVLTHMFFTLILNMTVNHLDVPDVVMGFRYTLLSPSFSSNINPNRSVWDIGELIYVSVCGLALLICCFGNNNLAVVSKV